MLPLFGVARPGPLNDPRALPSALSLESGAWKTTSPPADAPDVEHLPNKGRKQLLWAVVALGAMLSYALLTGMVSIQHEQQEELRAVGPGDQEEEGGDG